MAPFLFRLGLLLALVGTASASLASLAVDHGGLIRLGPVGGFVRQVTLDAADPEPLPVPVVDETEQGETSDPALSDAEPSGAETSASKKDTSPPSPNTADIETSSDASKNTTKTIAEIADEKEEGEEAEKAKEAAKAKAKVKAKAKAKAKAKEEADAEAKAKEEADAETKVTEEEGKKGEEWAPWKIGVGVGAGAVTFIVPLIFCFLCGCCPSCCGRGDGGDKDGLYDSSDDLEASASGRGESLSQSSRQTSRSLASGAENSGRLDVRFSELGSGRIPGDVYQ